MSIQTCIKENKYLIVGVLSVMQNKHRLDLRK